MTPLMVLASLFGSALVHGVELSWAWESNPQTLALAAVVSTLLPVPMAFDVILSHAFYTLGMPVGLVVTLLCGLGPFSVFAFVVTWRTISPRVATGFLGATMLVALAAGVLTPWIHHRLYIEPLLRGSRLSSFPVGQAGPDPVVPEPAVFAKLPPAVPFVVVQDTGEVRVEARGFRPSEAVQKQHFRYREGPEIGLRSGFAQEIRDYPDPFWIGRGTASGDIDGDDWPDVVFGSNHGPLIYRNHGGRFAPQPRAPIPIRTWKTYAVALVDLDGDGALDLYFSTFNRGTYCALNRSGAIDWRTLRQVPNGGGILTVAPAFADVDLDGEIDIVAGNMALGIVTGFRELGQGRRNALILNRRGRFEAWDFPGPDAETMSTLISDLDGDGQVDIYFSNDFNAADRLYRGRGGGTFQEHSFSGPTPVFSMSADSGDVNGDGRVDLSLSGTIALKPWVARKGLDGRSGSEAVSMPSLESVCAEVQDLFSREQCRRLARSHAVLARHRAIDPRGCDEQETRQEQQECWLAVGWSLVTRESVTDVCPSLEEPMLRELCAILARRGPRLSGEGARQLDDPQLLLRGPDGYEALPFSHPGGWTWNTRVVDVDGDGWLDLLGAEGVVGESQPGFNTLMMNHQGTRFSFEAFSRGWTNR
ncbi:MAG: VCBS repeat-containing protein, partial [Myxococcota bacterium]